MVTLQTAKKIALTFFIIGTLLFGMQWLMKDWFGLVFLGIIFIGIALLVNGIAFIVLLKKLLTEDCLESFFGMCILLCNVPVAFLYAYILINHI